MLDRMRNTLDFSSLAGLLSTLFGLVVVSLVAITIRLLVMTGVQQRRERQNRQINERLKTLIAAYKVLGGSFTGDLTVDPSHLRDLRARADAADAALRRAEAGAALAPDGAAASASSRADTAGSERRRRVRDAVEAALSDVMLLGTREQVSLAVQAAGDMVAGRPIETAALVESLRVFIREVLDLEPMPEGLAIPRQGPMRASSGGKSAGGGGDGKGGGRAGGGGGGGGGPAGGDGLGLHAPHHGRLADDTAPSHG